MMTTDSTPAGLSGLVAQILGGLGEGSTLEGVNGDEFFHSLAGQIKSLMVERGADPVEVAAIDDEMLMTQLLALVQGQTEPTADSGGLSPLGRQEETADFSEQGDDSDESSSEPESGLLAGLASLPTVVLEQLSEAGRLLSREGSLDPPGARSGSGDPSSLDPGVLRRALESRPSVMQDSGFSEVGEADQPLSRKGPLDPPGARSGSGDPSSLDPGVLRRALESRPLVMQDSGFSEVGEADQPLSRKGPLDPPGARSGSMERLETVEFGPVPPSWRARHPISGDLEPSPSWATASMRRDPVRDTAPTLQPGLESNDLMDPAEFSEPSDPMPSAPTHLPTTDTMTTASRLQSLDLDRLLRPGGEQRLAEQVRWSVDQGLDTAEIKLHPPSLGSLDVRIVQEGDKTHVHFVSAHPIAREVLEAVIPRLREALAQDGVLLGDVSVSDQAPSDRGEAWRERGQSAGTGDHEAEDDEDRSESIGTLSILSRRLDVFT